jgi:F-type H+-transporting ATPase subunit epsilon
MTGDAIQLEVLTPERQIISVQVMELQFPTLHNGYYGVLPGHTPVVTPVGDGLVTFVKDSKKHWVTVFGGFAEVAQDRVTILARVSETVDMIDVERAKSARIRALQAASEARVERDLDNAQASLRASLIRLQAAGHPGGHGY